MACVKICGSLNEATSINVGMPYSFPLMEEVPHKFPDSCSWFCLLGHSTSIAYTFGTLTGCDWEVTVYVKNKVFECCKPQLNLVVVNMPIV